MSSRLTRHAGVATALVALVGGLLAAAGPATAASSSVRLSSADVVNGQPLIAVNSSQLAYIKLNCAHRTKSCSGTIRVGEGSTKYTSYSLKPKQWKYVKVAVTRNSAADPHGTTPGDAPLNGRTQPLTISESKPAKVKTTRNAYVEKRAYSQWVQGSLVYSGARPQNLRIDAIAASRAGTRTDYKADIEGNSYKVKVPLGSNNAPSGLYKLKISGDVDNVNRSWWYRIGGATSEGNVGSKHASGGRYDGEATAVRVSRKGPQVADFRWSSVTGTVRRNGQVASGAEVSAVLRPSAFPRDYRDRRNLDVQSCGNTVNADKTNSSGQYTLSFLPYAAGYAIRAESGDLDAWRGAGNQDYSSCYHAQRYAFSSANLLLVDDGANAGAHRVQDIDVKTPTTVLKSNANYSGYKPNYSDRVARIREYIPGRRILDTPVTQTRTADGNGITKFTVPPGKYWLENGRRTGCADWFPSRFRNNNLYFKGVDRKSERWKTVDGKYPESKYSYTMGYKAKKPPKGRKGWMYRYHCTSADGTGDYTRVTVGADDQDNTSTPYVTRTVKKGGIITGRVKRSRGRENAEMLVTASSSLGYNVMRTDLTDGSGRFKITGLAPGNYRISVNTDSWRGNARSFKGTKTKRVKAGKSYSVGTLRVY